jgi:hypothetical protein
LLLQCGAVVGQSVSFTHCTQTAASPRVSQTGLPASLQSVLTAHCSQRPPPGSQIGVGAAQSVFARHCTQRLSAVSHSAVGAAHCVFDVQPVRHAKSRGSQIGAAVPQFEFDRHSTHVWSPGKQNGADAPQSLFARQATHSSVVVSHSGRCVPAQSVFALHPMQSPDAVSQIGVAPLQLCAPVHAAWQRLSAQHAGIATGQSAFDAHCWQLPSTQRGSVAGQSVFALHCTQPSVVLHSSPMRQATVPLTPQIALPGAGWFFELLHAHKKARHRKVDFMRPS